MFNVKVSNNLSKVFDKLDMIKINIESGVAESISVSESEIKDLFNAEYFESTDVEIAPVSEGVSVVIKSVEKYPGSYESGTGHDYASISRKVKDVMINKINLKSGKR